MSGINQYQPDPLNRRSLSDLCWDGQHRRKEHGDWLGCSGWKQACEKCAKRKCKAPECSCECHSACECLCHVREPRKVIKREPPSEKTFMEVYGVIDVGGKEKERKEILKQMRGK